MSAGRARSKLALRSRLSGVYAMASLMGAHAAPFASHLPVPGPHSVCRLRIDVGVPLVCAALSLCPALVCVFLRASGRVEIVLLLCSGFGGLYSLQQLASATQSNGASTTVHPYV